ncbi:MULTISPECIES: ParM/StbA family protein [Cyanophyceae]|uniref:ParM/StbA family protein n=1 Tax=Cyanophyceae TaxID=3028117 RepID=UPI0016826301|nr:MULTISPECIES: ParM/StbA family protein [Cyanophyceae]MBD1915440.1 ParM/StbA family protein [Phormidium sp. FACHB-77]MBD2028511.1 ParM/StbA family protein [Phormidium sp. FACHB-322]MBD2051051.1 ParM/StbA family protein [Leptolyngbya sp. FACHB-60]
MTTTTAPRSRSAAGATRSSAKARGTQAASATTPVLALDAGNYDLKFFAGSGHPKAIRSVRYQLPLGRDAVSFSEASPLIELPDGRRYHFGAQAYKYRRQQQTVIENKVELTKLHLYACLEPLAGNVADYSLNLHVSTPDPARNGEDIQAQLLGVHEFIRNDVEFRVKVESVEVGREGMGSYHYAKTQGIIPGQGYTIVVDIGGGTWLTRLVDADGEVIDENIMDRGGTYELATAISFDHRLTDLLGSSADPCIVMDGFRTDHVYADTGLAWADWLDEYLDPWFKGIFQTVKAQYTPYMPRVTRFLVTGGGSHLIADRLQGHDLFAVMGDPQFANVRGLFLMTGDTQLCMTTN